MAAGKITIDIEARIGNLEATMQSLEDTINVSTTKMEKDIGKLQTSFSTLRTAMTKVGLAVTAMIVGFRVLESVGRGIKAFFVAVSSSADEARESLNEFVESLKRIPIIGSAVAGMESFVDLFVGSKEHIEMRQKQIEKMQRDMQKMAELRQKKQGIAESTQINLNEAINQLALFKEQDQIEKVILETEQKRVATIKEFSKQLVLAQVIGMSDKHIQSLREEFTARLELIELIKKQRLEQIELQREQQRKSIGMDLRRAENDLRIFSAQTDTHKTLLQLEQKRVETVAQFEEKIRQIESSGLGDKQIEKVRTEMMMRLKLIELTKQQAMAIAEIDGSLELQQRQLKSSKEDLSRNNFFSNLRTTGTIETVVGGFTSALGLGRQDVVARAAETQVLIQRQIRTILQRIERDLRDRENAQQGIF